MDPFESITQDPLGEILKLVGPHTIFRLSCVSKAWRGGVLSCITADSNCLSRILTALLRIEKSAPTISALASQPSRPAVQLRISCDIIHLERVKQIADRAIELMTNSMAAHDLGSSGNTFR